MVAGRSPLFGGWEAAALVRPRRSRPLSIGERPLVGDWEAVALWRLGGNHPLEVAERNTQEVGCWAAAPWRHWRRRSGRPVGGVDAAALWASARRTPCEGRDQERAIRDLRKEQSKTPERRIPSNEEATGRDITKKQPQTP